MLYNLKAFCFKIQTLLQSKQKDKNESTNTYKVPLLRLIVDGVKVVHLCHFLLFLNWRWGGGRGWGDIFFDFLDNIAILSDVGSSFNPCIPGNL